MSRPDDNSFFAILLSFVLKRLALLFLCEKESEGFFNNIRLDKFSAELNAVAHL
jgi:hypothetical protein